MDYAEFLKKSAAERKSIACVGIDPVLEKIPVKGQGVEETLVFFYSEIIGAFESENEWPSAFKPNYAFFAQYGFEGLRALQKIIEIVKKTGIPLIFDGKRGDIGNTSKAYAAEAFDFWNADALTVSPFLGKDSVNPFLEKAAAKGKGLYFLNRTSNPGAAEFQSLLADGKPLYMITSEKIALWNKECAGAGAVVGATSLPELEQIAKFYASQKAFVPLLIPGVGSQGGSAKETVAVLEKCGYPLHLARINSSGGINFAFEKTGSSDFAGAAAKALRELNKEIGYK
ncbi:MAG: orotidine-5'-phosphate decarboxylase [Candidatus Diapherotrites archaeon]